MAGEINRAIAHITDGDHAFQVLNEEGTDWDEAATRALYDAWLAEQAAPDEPGADDAAPAA